MKTKYWTAIRIFPGNQIDVLGKPFSNKRDARKELIAMRNGSAFIVKADKFGDPTTTRVG